MVTSKTRSVGGVMVSIVAFQAVDPGSIPGHRKLYEDSIPNSDSGGHLTNETSLYVFQTIQIL